MFLSRIRFDTDRATLSDLIHRGRTDGYRTHQAIWRLFSAEPGQDRPFLYRHESAQGLPSFHTLSAQEPLDLEGLWKIETKPFAPRLRAGDRLAFVLTANPVVSRRDSDGRLHRHDLVMDRKHHLGKESRPPMAELIREAGLDWLTARCAGLGFGFERRDVLVAGYRQHRLFKSTGSSPIRFSTIDLNGLLTVDEPEVFVERALFSGIGPAKGFGCGLLLVRRA